ncbi:MAG: hypothetical protein JWM40_2078 [Frankiales bacterium]|nr:hypothetical protein [Frankiales bacterium]
MAHSSRLPGHGTVQLALLVLGVVCLALLVVLALAGLAGWL